MEDDQPDDVLAVVHVVVANIPSKAAYGYIDSSGQRVICADRSVIKGDPVARESAFRAFVTQVTDGLGGSPSE